MVYATNSAGYQTFPTEQPLAEEPYYDAPAAYGAPLSFDARAKAAALRAYQNAATQSFGARGELSSDLDAINQLEDFNYSPGALQYLQDVAGFQSNSPYAGALSSMDLYKTDQQTGAVTPYTSAYLEQAAARGDIGDRMYASFDPATGLSAPRSTNTIQFDPNAEYRVVDRSTGQVLHTGTGYDAGAKIAELTKGIYDDKGVKANWDVQRNDGGTWNTARDQDPQTSGFLNFLMMAAPFAALSALPMLGLAGGSAAGGAAGAATAHGGISAALGAGGIANAAPALGALGAGTTAGAALAAPTLGALSSAAAPITVVGAPAAGGISAGTLAGTGLTAGAGLASSLTGASPVNSAATQNLPDDIVVSGSNPASAITAGEVGALTGGVGGALAGISAIQPNAITPTAGESPSTLSKISKYLELAGYGTGLLGNLIGGGGNSAATGTIPGGAFGSLNPVFSNALPSANLPGVGDMSPRVMPQQDWATYGMRPEQSFFNNVPQNPQGFADGGDVRGPGTGRSDSIPAVLSNGEYVFDAETVALLGDGSTDAGADMLDQFRVNIRKHKGKNLSRGEISPDAKRPEHYLSGGLA